LSNSLRISRTYILDIHCYQKNWKCHSLLLNIYSQYSTSYVHGNW
jgi:hypothetical protein